MSRNLLPLSFTMSAALCAGSAIADVPRVVVDIAPVHSLVAQVMDGVGTPDLIVPAGASPHEYNLRPSEAGALQAADLVIWMGEDLTPWMADAIGTLASEARVTALLESEATTLLPFRQGALFEAHDHGDSDAHGHDDHDHDQDAHDHDHAEDHGHADDHDHDHADDHGHADGDHGDDAAHAELHGDDHDDHGHHDGHEHGDHDPHAWLSPDNAAAWLNVIAGALSALDPENAGTYFGNAATARTEMDTLVTEVHDSLEPVRGGRFVVFHDAYQYFEVAFDMPASGAISLSDARDPSPARIAEIQQRVTDEGIACVLAEPQFDSGIVATVTEGTEANVAVLDPLGSDLAPGPDHYPRMMRNLATALAGCL